MCGRFTPITHDELSAIVADIERDRAAARGDAADVRFASAASGAPADRVGERPEPAVRDAFPKSVMPVIVKRDSGLQVADLIWGYSVSWNKNAVFNTRAETALGSTGNMWADSLRNRRCIVAARGFYEPHATETRVSPRTGKTVKRQYRFTLPGQDVLFMAGVWQDDRFSIMTCAPNRWMQPVHDRMPIVLRRDELATWMGDDFAHLFNREDIQLDSVAV